MALNPKRMASGDGTLKDDDLVLLAKAGELDLTSHESTLNFRCTGEVLNDALEVAASKRVGAGPLFWAGDIEGDWQVGSDLPEIVVSGSVFTGSVYVDDPNSRVSLVDTEVHGDFVTYEADEIYLEGFVGGDVTIQGRSIHVKEVIGTIEGRVLLDLTSDHHLPMNVIAKGGVGIQPGAILRSGISVLGEVFSDFSIDGTVGRVILNGEYGRIHAALDSSIESDLLLRGRVHQGIEILGDVAGACEISGNVDGDINVGGAIQGRLRLQGDIEGNVFLAAPVEGGLVVGSRIAGVLDLAGSGVSKGRIGAPGVAVESSAEIVAGMTVSSEISGDLEIRGKVAKFSMAERGNIRGRTILLPAYEEPEGDVNSLMKVDDISSGRFGDLVLVGDGVNMDECNMSRCPDIDKFNLIGRHIFADGPNLVAESELELAGTYRQIRSNLESRNNRPGAARFYEAEMASRRRAARSMGRKVERAVLFLYWLLSGYGLKAGRAAGWFVAMALVGATLLVVDGLDLDPTPVLLDSEGAILSANVNKASPGEALVFTVTWRVQGVTATC